jgi:hypothetical protein
MEGEMDVSAEAKRLADELRGKARPGMALGGIDICPSWPAVRAVLQAIASATSNPIIKVAINVITGAGDLLCKK